MILTTALWVSVLFLRAKASCPHEDESLVRWSDAASWTSGQLPVEGEGVSIENSILLDISTPDLANITIEPGFKLVFDPEAELSKLSASSVLVLGELWIGSEDCLFGGQAEIELTGKKDESIAVDVNGGSHEKAILVPSGGSLEIHGAEKLVWTRLAETIHATPDDAEHDYIIVTLQEDADSWQAGDKIVIASTDYDADQAETVELAECSDCNANQIKVCNQFEFTHWGETTNNVPMAAEVGMLSRNVRIYGRMEEQCYGSNKCDEFDFDTYGGHIKMFSGFASARVVNAELYNMGQNSRLGSYPIHFHMCGDISDMDKQPVVKYNSIHHTFARCLTIHGTSGILAEGNLAYDHYGHCFFLEDGGELNTVLKYNLGLLTRLTDIITSDEEAATYWITHPSTTVIGNVAAGSEKYGFWYVFPREPTGPSADSGLLGENEALRTPLSPFQDNVAHSNRFYGIRFDDILKSNGDISGGFDYNPRVDPTDPDSDRVPVLFEGFTAFKNYKSVRIRGPSITLDNFKVAESVEGIKLSSSDVGIKRITNSLIVGETENKGEPERWIRLLNGTRIWWDRSIRMGGDDKALPIIGVVLFDAPVILENVTFSKFETNVVRPSGAIGFKRKNKCYTSTVNSVSGLQYDYDDPMEGNRFYEADSGRGYTDNNGNINQVLRDDDGSLTTYAGSSIVKPYGFLLNARCAEVPQWNMYVCPAKFTKIRFMGMSQPDSFITRNDLSASYSSYLSNPKPLSYALNTEESYIVHFNSTVPRKIRFKVTGVEAGAPQFVGVCVGVNAQVRRILVDDGTRVNSYSDLTSADDGVTRYYYDETAGLVMFRFASSHARSSTTDSECPGDEGADSPCPSVFIRLVSSNSDGDCTSRAYPTYQTQPVSTEGGLTTPSFV